MFCDQCLLSFASRKAKPRILVSIMAQGSQLASLLPTDVRHWWPIIEDVFTSPAVASLTVKLLTTFRDLREFQVISIDATIKCCMGVLGQVSYRAPKAKRDQAPFDDDHAFRRVLTVRGRTGAVLGMCAMASEKAEDVCMALTEMLPADGLACHRIVPQPSSMPS